MTIESLGIEALQDQIHRATSLELTTTTTHRSASFSPTSSSNNNQALFNENQLASEEALDLNQPDYSPPSLSLK